MDVLRAQVQLANDKQALLEAQNEYQAIASSTGTQSWDESGLLPLELAEPLHYQALAQSQPEDTVAEPR